MTPIINVSTDLRCLFGPVRDQGARPTCLAFAASDTHAGLRDGWCPLSCEFAFYHAQRRAGRLPTTGSVLSAMLDALRLDGQPREEGWPYLHATPENRSLWRPPHEVGPLYGRNAVSGRWLGQSCRLWTAAGRLSP
jgi:hypothetical protein